MRPVTFDEIESLAIGAWILGTGGGGSPYLALLNMRQLYKQGVICQLVDASELDDDDLVAVVSNMGAPLVGQERLTDPKTMALAVTMMEEYLGRKFRAVMSLEIGGGNAIQPFMAAAMLDLPVMDGDCMGRAFPEAQMTSFAIHDLRMYPLTLADVRDNAVVVARAAALEVDGADQPQSLRGGRLHRLHVQGAAHRQGDKECAILGSTTKAIGIGRAVQAARRVHRDPIDAVLEGPTGSSSSRGKIHDIARRTTEGFLRGTADDRRPRRFPRPHLRARLPERVRGRLARRQAARHDARPDLRARTVSGDAIGTETLRYGQRVTVLALPAPPILLTPRGSSTWGRAPSATIWTSPRCSREAARRHRCGRHQHRRCSAGRRRGLGGGEDAPLPDVTSGITRALAGLVQQAPSAQRSGRKPAAGKRKRTAATGRVERYVGRHKPKPARRPGLCCALARPPRREASGHAGLSATQADFASGRPVYTRITARA